MGGGNCLPKISLEGGLYVAHQLKNGSHRHHSPRLHQQDWSQRRIARGTTDRSGDRLSLSAVGRGAKTSQQGGCASGFKTSHFRTGALNDPVPPAHANRSERLHIVYNAVCRVPSTPSPASQCPSTNRCPWPSWTKGWCRPADLARSGERARLSRTSITACGVLWPDLGAKTPVPFRRMECGPGEEVQVDFGQGAVSSC